MEIKELTDKINREWEEFKAVINGQAEGEVKKFGAMLGDTNAKLDKINARLDELEVKALRPRNGGDGAGEGDGEFKLAMKAFDKFCRKGEHALNAEEKKLLAMERKVMVVSGDSTGGYGAPSEFDSSIIKGVTDISPMRGLVSVRNTSMRSARVMKRVGTFAAVWVGEVTERTETTGLSYGMEEIPTHETYAMVDVSKQDLEDTAFDLEGELRTEFTEQFAVQEGTGVINGNGVAKMEGLLQNAAVAEDVTGDANLLTYEGFVDVSHNGKEAYLSASRYIFNLKTLGAVRKLKSGTGEMLWTPMASGAPANILGFPYTIVPGMPAVAAGNYPVMFGAYARAYRLVDRVALEIVRDELTQANKGAVRFYARKRLGGQVLVAEAVRKLKVSA